MKRGRLLFSLLTLLFLCACAVSESGIAEPAPSSYVDVKQVSQAVLDSQSDSEGLLALTPEEKTDYLTAVCGVEEGVWTESAVYMASGVDARELIILRLSQLEYGETVAQALEEHRQNRLGDFYGYAPEQAALLEQAVVTVQDGYAALLVCKEPEPALAAFEAALGGGTAEPMPSEEAPAEPSATVDVSAFAPFDPPNEYNMTLYDTGPILSAWESGDESGLTEKDSAILARCREILEDCVSEDMSDFEKELSLHDALVRLGRYDRTVYNAKTPQGLPDNTNPYGFLVEGYGICLGYATSFQLLMDLAGVECITVVGASSNSTSDHAWNMVRLEGEWYCVDPTWNDATSMEYVPEKEWARTHHIYFNVTSDFMRESDHQWDYTAVPEATATRFFWDGTGALPQ